MYKTVSCLNINDIPSNTVVTIIENMILPSIIRLTKLVNISLIGYDSSIHCKNNGGLEFTSCSNIAITGITWTEFINNKVNVSYSNTGRIKFYESSNIKIHNCTFQHLVEKALIFSQVFGNVSIKYCKFMDNKNQEHGAVIHYLPCRLH